MVWKIIRRLMNEIKLSSSWILSQFEGIGGSSNPTLLFVSYHTVWVSTPKVLVAKVVIYHRLLRELHNVFLLTTNIIQHGQIVWVTSH